MHGRFHRRHGEPGPGAYLCSCHFPEGKRENGPVIFSSDEQKKNVVYRSLDNKAKSVIVMKDDGTKARTTNETDTFYKNQLSSNSSKADLLNYNDSNRKEILGTKRISAFTITPLEQKEGNPGPSKAQKKKALVIKKKIVGGKKLFKPGMWEKPRMEAGDEFVDNQNTDDNIEPSPTVSEAGPSKTDEKQSIMIHCVWLTEDKNDNLISENDEEQMFEETLTDPLGSATESVEAADGPSTPENAYYDTSATDTASEGGEVSCDSILLGPGKRRLEMPDIRPKKRVRFLLPEDETENEAESCEKALSPQASSNRRPMNDTVVEASSLKSNSESENQKTPEGDRRNNENCERRISKRTTFGNLYYGWKSDDLTNRRKRDGHPRKKSTTETHGEKEEVAGVSDKSPRANSVTDTIKSSRKKLAADVAKLKKAKRTSDNSQKLPRTNPESEKEKLPRMDSVADTKLPRSKPTAGVAKLPKSKRTKTSLESEKEFSRTDSIGDDTKSSKTKPSGASSERVSTKRRRRRSHLTMRRKKKVPKPKNNDEEIPSCNDEAGTDDDSVLPEDDELEVTNDKAALSSKMSVVDDKSEFYNKGLQLRNGQKVQKKIRSLASVISKRETTSSSNDGPEGLEVISGSAIEMSSQELKNKKLYSDSDVINLSNGESAESKVNLDKEALSSSLRLKSEYKRLSLPNNDSIPLSDAEMQVDKTDAQSSTIDSQSLLAENRIKTKKEIVENEVWLPDVEFEESYTLSEDSGSQDSGSEDGSPQFSTPSPIGQTYGLSKAPFGEMQRPTTPRKDSGTTTPDDIERAHGAKEAAHSRGGSSTEARGVIRVKTISELSNEMPSELIPKQERPKIIKVIRVLKPAAPSSKSGISRASCSPKPSQSLLSSSRVLHSHRRNRSSRPPAPQIVTRSVKKTCRTVDTVYWTGKIISTRVEKSCDDQGETSRQDSEDDVTLLDSPPGSPVSDLSDDDMTEYPGRDRKKDPLQSSDDSDVELGSVVRHSPDDWTLIKSSLYWCQEKKCRFSTDYLDELTVHQTEEHSSKESEVDCPLCGNTSKHMLLLMRHLDTEHGDVEVSEGIFAGEGHESQGQEDLVKCPFCYFSGVHYSITLRHLKMVHSPKRGFYHCYFCTFHTDKVVCMSVHYTTRHGAGSATHCALCVHANSCAMKLNVPSVDPGIWRRPFCCEFCDVSTLDSEVFLKHIVSSHLS